MHISVDEVRRIAALARLDLDDARAVRYCQQLSAILEHMTKLRQLETGDILAGELAPADSALRTDVPRSGLDHDALLANAPETEDGQFKIPPVFGKM